MSSDSEIEESFSNLRQLLIYRFLEDDNDCAEILDMCILQSADKHEQCLKDSSKKRRRQQLATIFPDLSDSQFRTRFRTTREGFSGLLEKIQSHPTFTNKSNYAQANPTLQLAVTLTRLGANEQGATVSEIKSMFGISAGSVVTYTNRVISVLVDLKKEVFLWPNVEDRAEFGLYMRKEGFPNCFGFIGASTLPLLRKPTLHSEIAHDRKNNYSVAMQVTCDVDSRIIALGTGHPGSWTASDIYRHSCPFKEPKTFFSPGEYILAGPEFDLTRTCVSPFKAPVSNTESNKEFNQCLAKSHKRVTDCIGTLKSRWKSLRELRHQIRSAEDIEAIGNWVLACGVLHNLLIDLDDPWEWVFLEEDKADPTETGAAKALPAQRAVVFRETLKKTTLETNKKRGRLPATKKRKKINN